MSSYDLQYQAALNRILQYGYDSDDRTGVGTRKMFDVNFNDDLRHEVADEYKLPALTIRKVFPRTAFYELMWMLNGITNVDWLYERNINIWNGNSTREFLDSRGLYHIREGHIGRGYGYQIRNFNGVDQLEELFKGLYYNPNGRRHLISFWNPGDLKEMALPPCFVAGTQVALATGEYKAIDSISVGDSVLTSSGEYHQVYNVMKTPYDGDFVTIKATGIPNTTCTPNHLFLVKDKGYVKASSINVGDFVLVRGASEHENIPSFEIKKHSKAWGVESERTEEIFRLDSEEKWFMLGYFVGNGYVTSNREGAKPDRGTISIPLHKENDIINRFGGVINLYVKNRTQSMVAMEFSSRRWSTVFREFGSKAHGKFIPTWVEESPKWAIESFLEGYIAADGCILGNSYSITTVSPSLAYGVQRLFTKMGKSARVSKQVRPKTTIIEGRIVNQRDTYTISVRIDETKRRSFNFIHNESGMWCKVAKVTHEKSNEHDGFVYNLSVDTDHTYTANNIVNHNCHLLYNFVVTGEYLNLKFYQRSADMILGVPTNICFATFFLTLVAKSLGFKVGEVAHSIGDAHIYSNHIEVAEELVNRDAFDQPVFSMWVPKYDPTQGIESVLAPYRDENAWETYVHLTYKSHPPIDKSRLTMAV